MKTSLRHRRPQMVPLFAVCSLVLLQTSAVAADEGMWTFDNPPAKQLQERYNFTPTQEWLDHVRLSSVRFNDGGSGSFVSPRGLALTNHHVALGQLQKISTPQKDYVRDGFYARTQAEEVKCPDLELNVLMSMEDVTTPVLRVLKPGMSDKEANDARKAEIAKIEKESLDKTGLRSDVISLYQGGEYWLYRYKKYTDVRMVFAPEQQIAFFGGDPDNFTYPRYDLDMAIFRVYYNGKPLDTKDYLKWNPKGALDQNLVFVAGHPGSTSRLETVAQLETERDVEDPMNLKVLKDRIAALKRYSAQGAEQAREAESQIFYLENSLKAIDGRYQGLLDSKVMAKKQRDEQDLRSKVMANPEWKAAYGGAWDAIADVERKAASRIQETYLHRLNSEFATIAMNIVEYVAEIRKPDGERLPGFHDAQLDSLKFRMFSPAPIYRGLEIARIVASLEQLRAEMGPNDPFLRLVLKGRTSEQAASELVNGTKLADPAARKMLVEGGEGALQASTDPMIVLARELRSEERR